MIGFSLGIGVGGGGRLRFLPTAIFTASEPGAWYDPSDLTTLFQDSAGTTPVTAPAQTVGLMLDKSKGLVLGSELVTNGNFSDGSTGWTFVGTLPNITISGGVASFAASTGNRWLVQNGILTVGKSYQITATVTVSAGTIGPDINGFSGSVSSSGTYTWRITNVTLTQLQFLANNTFVGTIDNISVKLLAGNHATQATLAQRPTYGINPTTGTRNLLTFTEQLNNAAWTLASATVTANAGTAPDGTLTAEKLIASATAATHSAGQNLTVPTATTYTGSVYVKAGEYNFAAVLLLTTFAAAQFIICDLTLGTIITTSGSPLATSITAVGNGWYRISITQITNAAGTANIQVRPSNSGTTTFFTGDGTSGIYAWGAQLEVSATATAYQKVVSQYEVTEAGVASASYLSFDGVDDGMVTGTITPGIDKVQMFAGIHKLSDAALQTVAEFSANPTNLLFPGSCGLTLSPGAPNTFAFFVSGGSIPNARANVNLDASPQTKVFSGIGDISADSSIARVNGVQLGSAAADQGTGNYLAYPLYIGRRAAWGATSPFSGRIYSLIVRFGANLTAGQIASTELYVNLKTGAY